MKSLRNEKGTVIETVIIVLLVVMILGGGIVSIAYSYYKRSFDDANGRTAYLIASSAAQSIGREIASKNNDNDYKDYVPTNVGDKVTLSKLKLTGDDVNESFESVKDETYIKLTDETTLEIKITIKAKGQTASATQTLLKNNKDENVWQLGKLR